VVNVLLRQASAGKGAALRICFDRIAPLRKGWPVPVELPPLACHDDVVAAAAAVVMGMADRELTSAEAQDIFKVLEAFARVLTPWAGPERVPAADAAVSRQPWEPAKTCKSPGSAAEAADENAEAPDPVPPSPATGDEAPAADADARRQPQEPAETCSPPESEADAVHENAEALEPVPPPPTTPDPAPPVAAEAGRQPQEPVETCKSPESEAGAGEENVPAAPDPAPQWPLRQARRLEPLEKPVNHPDPPTRRAAKMPDTALRRSRPASAARRSRPGRRTLQGLPTRRHTARCLPARRCSPRPAI